MEPGSPWNAKTVDVDGFWDVANMGASQFREIVMPAMKHPLSGAMYRVCGDGLVEVDNNGVKGVFRYDGRYISGELRHADPHMVLWLGGPQLPEGSAPRRQRDYHATIAGPKGE